MNFRFAALTATARRTYTRMAMAILGFFGSSLDDIVSALSYVSAELDQHEARLGQRLDRNMEASLASYQREQALRETERSLREDVEADTEEAIKEMDRARRIRARVDALLS